MTGPTKEKTAADKVTDALRYRGASEGEVKIVAFVFELQKATSAKLGLAEDSVTLALPKPGNPNGGQLGDYVVREGVKYTSEMRATIKGVVATVEFSLVLNKDPMLPETQNQRWHIDVGAGPVFVGLGTATSPPQPRDAAKILSAALESRLVENAKAAK